MSVALGRTRLEDRHLERFAALTHDQVEMVIASAGALWSHDTPGHPPPPDVPVYLGSRRWPLAGEDAFHYCQGLGLDMALTILSLAGRPEATARGAVETLHGKPIVPWAASVEAAVAEPQARRGPSGVAPRPAPAGKTDDRRVLRVAPCPHRDGTDAARSYAGWVVGDTVQACIGRGTTRRSVRRDVRAGHVEVGR